MNEKIKISVIIPVYNCENKIKRCLDSVSKQTYKNFQIVLINDGSSDKTDDEINKYLKNNKNIEIKYVKTKNCGVSHARNIGLEEANGEIITFLDADDYYDCGYFESIYKNFKDVDILLYGYRTIFNNKETDICYGKNLEGTRDYIYRELSRKNLFNPVCNKVYAKKIITGNKFNEELSLGEDFLFFTNCLYKTNKVRYLDEIYYNYEIDLDGLGFRRRENMFEAKLLGMSGILKIYQDNNYNIKDISGTYVKNYISDFIALYLKKEFSKKEISCLQVNATKKFNFKSLKYKFYYKLLLSIFLSNNYFLIKICTIILLKIDIYRKKKNFKIQR